MNDPPEDEIHTITIHYAIEPDGLGERSNESEDAGHNEGPDFGVGAGAGTSNGAGGQFSEDSPGHPRSRFFTFHGHYTVSPRLVVHVSNASGQTIETAIRHLVNQQLEEVQQYDKASARAIRSLHRVQLSDIPCSERDCTICYEPLTEVPEVHDKEEAETDEEEYPPDDQNDHSPVAMPCSHIFGMSCLRSWLGGAPSCPLCRVKIESVFERNSSRLWRRDEGRSPFVTHVLFPEDERTRRVRAHRSQRLSMMEILNSINIGRQHARDAQRSENFGYPEHTEHTEHTEHPEHSEHSEHPEYSEHSEQPGHSDRHREHTAQDSGTSHADHSEAGSWGTDSQPELAEQTEAFTARMEHITGQAESHGPEPTQYPLGGGSIYDSGALHRLRSALGLVSSGTSSSSRDTSTVNTPIQSAPDTPGTPSSWTSSPEPASRHDRRRGPQRSQSSQSRVHPYNRP